MSTLRIWHSVAGRCSICYNSARIGFPFARCALPATPLESYFPREARPRVSPVRPPVPPVSKFPRASRAQVPPSACSPSHLTHDSFSSLIVHYGYVVILPNCFCGSCRCAGTRRSGSCCQRSCCCSRSSAGPAVSVVCVAAMLSADSLLYILGRHIRWTNILKFLCQVSVDPGRMRSALRGIVVEDVDGSRC